MKNEAISGLPNYIKEADEAGANSAEVLLHHFTPDCADSVLAYHKSLPGYKATPLVSLAGLAGYLGVANIWVKDESKRFDLNAFKVLGSSYALARYILGESTQISYERAVGVSSGISSLVSATDGNHGYGLAHVANLFNTKAKIYMPKGTVPERAERIRRLGAEVDVTEYNYDQCVDLAKQFAKETSGLFVQDTALVSDTVEEQEIPLYIMQGYMTILQESVEQDAAMRPTHVFLQCGVGSFAGSLTAYIVNKFKPRPVIVCVEPSEADCYYRSAQDGSGSMETVEGDMDSIMAGLCCGVPSTQGFSILRKYTDWFVRCEDSVTRRGMRVLAAPLPGDSRVVSGESGAVTTGLVYSLFKDERYAKLREDLQLNENSRVMLVSTEGDTDPEGYLKNIWE